MTPRIENALTIVGVGILNELRSKVQFAVPPFDVSTSDPLLLPNFDAIWDTGATNSVISQKVVDALKLTPVSMAEVRGVNSITRSPVYLVSVILPSRVIFNPLAVTRGEIPGCDALIGMDVIATGDFHISNVGGITMMSFRVPSRDQIDYVKIVNSQNRPTQSPPRGGHRPNPKKPRRR